MSRVKRLKSRCGAGLAEMLVALALSAFVSAAAATALTSAERYMRRTRATSDARRTLREAAALLGSELRAAASDAVRLRGDTAIDFLGLVGVSVVCVASGNVLVAPPDVAAGGFPYSSWRATPEAGDLLAVFDTAAGGTWRTVAVDTASTPSNGAGCKPSSGLISVADSAARRPVTRMVLRTALIPSPLLGAPLRVIRPGRYALTRAADGSWSLSYRRCTAALCGIAQPVVGPLAAPTDSGLVFSFVASESRLYVTMRTPQTSPAVQGESAALRLTLRNRAIGVP
jgi:type II secretory pathway pseudopilin PulG